MIELASFDEKPLIRAAIFMRKVASPAGFEPTAPGLGNLCSIQLSYGDSFVFVVRYFAPTVLSYATSLVPATKTKTCLFPKRLCLIRRFISTKS